MSKHNMFASLERNMLSNTNMSNVNVSILDCTSHTKNIYMRKDNVSIMNLHSNVKKEYVWGALTPFTFKHKHVKSQCCNSWLHFIHCKTICEDVSSNKQKTFTCEMTMLASWIRIQMSKYNMFESHWPNLPSYANMSNLNVSIVDCTPYIHCKPIC